MLYFANLKNGIQLIMPNDEVACNTFKESLEKTNELISIHETLSHVKDALSELEIWCRITPSQTNTIVQERDTAERLCRGFLSEFRSYLDHNETYILRNYGKESELFSIFKNGTHQAYDSSPEYAFTYNLRNYSQHCKNCVHNIQRNNIGIRPASNPQTLLKEYKKWKTKEKAYIQTFSGNIDLQNIFEATYNAMGYKIQQPLIQYLLEHTKIGSDIIYLRRYGEWFVKNFDNNVNNFHLLDILHQDNSSATAEEYHNGVDVMFTASTINWKAIYEITDLMKPSKSQ